MILPSDYKREISLRVEQNLQTYLDTPDQINQSNLTNIQLGKLDVQNFASFAFFLTNNDLCSALNQLATQISLTSDAEIIY